MKLMIASDIHGSAYFAKLLLERYREEKADRLLLLGDILYHGPRNDLPREYAPKEVLAMLNDMKEHIFCVRGNCDTEVDQMVLSFPVLADYAVIDLGDRLMYATHGHIYNENNLPPLKKGDILIYGHTHIPMVHTDKDVITMNPGSVSIPKENSHNGYMTVENGLFIWKNVTDGSVVSECKL